MSMRPYTLKQLQTFMEVAKQRSVSKAAERLFVTQPPYPCKSASWRTLLACP